MKKLLISLALTVISSTSAFADTNVQDANDSFFNDQSILELKFGGWSKHDSSDELQMQAPLNETHNGFGIEYYKGIRALPNHYLGLGAWYMKDSFDHNAYQVSLGYKYRWNIDYLIDSIDFNMNIGVVNRTFRSFTYSAVYNSNQFVDWELKDYEDVRKTKLTTMPMITVNVLEHLQADIVWYPKFVADMNNDYSLVFFRFGYQF